MLIPVSCQEPHLAIVTVLPLLKTANLEPSLLYVDDTAGRTLAGTIRTIKITVEVTNTVCNKN